MRPLAVRTAVILVAVLSSRLVAQGTGCRETTYPLTLPTPNALVDSAHAIADLSAFAAPSKPMRAGRRRGSCGRFVYASPVATRPR